MDNFINTYGLLFLFDFTIGIIYFLWSNRDKPYTNESWEKELNKSWREKQSFNLKDFFMAARKVGLVRNNTYTDGIPSGSNEDVEHFYYLEDRLNYPKSQKIK